MVDPIIQVSLNNAAIENEFRTSSRTSLVPVVPSTNTTVSNTYDNTTIGNPKVPTGSVVDLSGTYSLNLN
jgi:hypothetical protein